MTMIGELVCAYGMHTWELVYEGIQYNFLKCKKCPQERIEDK